MINSRLFDWYGIDTTKDLQIKNNVWNKKIYCTRPYDTVLIDKKGSCYLCECTSWLPQSVGNLYIQSLDDIINSKMSAELRNSIADSSYRYCNNKQCAYLLLVDEYNAPDWPTTIPVNKIKNIRLALDDSCNLSCPSCRVKPIFEKNKLALRKKFKIADKIIEFMQKQKNIVTVHIGSDGDPFASLVYRYFVDATKNMSNTRFTIQTNGLLIKKMYNRFKPLFEKLDTLNISIDGATKDTYEKLRRGGRWRKILENLSFLTSIKKKFSVNLHMVVQQDNWHEMRTMLELGEKFNVSKIYFNKVQDWNTGLDFTKQTFMQDKNFLTLLEEIKTNPLSYTNTLL